MKKRRITALLLASAMLLSLGACGSQPSGDAPHKQPTVGKQAQEPKKSSRGNIVKHIGEEAGISGKDGKDVADWTVTNIVIGPQCDGPNKENPQAGHFVELDINAVTTADFDPNKLGSLSVGEPYMWKYIQKDGTQWNGMPGSTAAESCMADTEKLPSTINKGIKAHGKVVFDLPSTDGTLVYTQGGSLGWEYPLGK
ncbi:hypothetical protein [Bifidobacterium sp. ESL0745]|uniref:hypothetical protein n=1 Tax=Bifidobacterium sp. ESL0745 TaxID=2983226 RepID=UPI0023F6EEA5|nr:hypothetical protein [Bifidobacterium sp. ESL0745]MDF7665691.1 hypothetical protein [Bifidobacterium sp. ESL0745]